MGTTFCAAWGLAIADPDHITGHHFGSRYDITSSLQVLKK